MATMQTYPVDLDPEQIVRWVVDEHQTRPSALRTAARRMIEVRDIPLQRELHLGDAEREDLSEVATVATLEIAPGQASDGWLLTVVVEDEIGPAGSDKSAAVEEEQQIDLGTFYSQFIRSGRGTASVTAEVENSAAEARVTRLLEAIENNSHAPRGGEAGA
jgi:hypothetical protein